MYIESFTRAVSLGHEHIRAHGGCRVESHLKPHAASVGIRGFQKVGEFTEGKCLRIDAKMLLVTNSVYWVILIQS